VPPGSFALQFPQAGRRMVLPQAFSADGDRYAAGGTEFWTKGRQARSARGDATTMCMASRRGY
jgi:membrane-bound inhibitor of C-type lysozyme